jgi:hypothetical protein
METLDDGSVHRVNTFSYQRYKFRLYQISSQIISDIYTQDMPNIPATVETVRLIHERLENWAASLPAELKLAELENFEDESEISTTFRLQALVLQSAYHNTKILLHRPLLACNLDQLPRTSASAIRKAVTLSKNQCWESAIRTSELAQYESRIRAALGSYGATYMGMHLFTAGMMLSVVALADPMSDKVLDAKHALARIIHMTRGLECESILASQSSVILEELVRLILSKEMEAILGTKRNNPAAAISSKPEHSVPFEDPLMPFSDSQDTQSHTIPVEHGQGPVAADTSPSYFTTDGNDLQDQVSIGDPWWDGINLDDGIYTMQQGKRRFQL